MSTPIDIPQNLNIQISHTEKVVEPKAPNQGNNTENSSSFGLAGQDVAKKHVTNSRDMKKEKKTSRSADHFKKKNKNESNKQSQDQEGDLDQVDEELEKNSPDIGAHIDFVI